MKQLDFIKEYPKGIYRTQFLAPAGIRNGMLKGINEKLLREDLAYLSNHPQQGFISNPDKFFQKWLNQTSCKNPNSEELGFGFELQIPQVEINEQLRGNLRGLVIAADLRYTGDFGSDIVFVVNDVNKGKVLTYHDQVGKTIKNNNLGRKLLLPRPVHGSAKRPEKFPFTSLDSLKFSEYVWSLVNVTPDEVYTSLRKIGFNW